MNQNLEGKLFSKKRAETLYRYALSRGDVEKAEKLREFYGLDTNLQKEGTFVYEALVSVGKVREAQKLNQNANLSRKVFEDKTNNNLQYLHHSMYDFTLEKIYNISQKLNSCNDDNECFKLRRKKLNLFYKLEEIKEETNIQRLPRADFRGINNGKSFEQLTQNFSLGYYKSETKKIA